MSRTSTVPPLSIFGDPQDPINGHERVTFCHDRPSGLRAIVAIHNTALGPSMGGTRFYPYPDEGAALADALRLSRAMTFKSAAAGISVGGGKGVIIGRPEDGTTAMFEAYGDLVESLGGRYVSACDVGTRPEDMDVVARRTRHAVGRTVAAGGSGDSGTSTADGVFIALTAVLRKLNGISLDEARVGVEGVGKVGGRLVDLLVAAGATVVVTDIDTSAVARVLARHPTVKASDSVLAERVDIYAPCGLGATLTMDSVADLAASVVCGGANNQLASPAVLDRMEARGIVWVPDYVANAGGIIQVAAEYVGEPEETMRGRIENIAHTVDDVLERAVREHSTTLAAANALVIDRLAAASA